MNIDDNLKMVKKKKKKIEIIKKLDNCSHN